MNEQPDKFFRDKLEGYHPSPPAAAWDRIEANLAKKNHKVIWLRVAAAVALLACAAYLLWPAGDSAPAPTVADKNQTPNTVEKELEKGAAEKQVPVTDDDNQQPARTQMAQNVTKKQIKPNKQAAIEAPVPVAVNKQEQQEPSQVETIADETITEVAVNDAATETVPQILEQESKEDNMIITLTAEEVNEKYLTKKTIADATTQEKKSSTLRKLLDKAYDLKHNQDPVGELRQMKNEILALNFKNDKRRQQQTNK